MTVTLFGREHPTHATLVEDPQTVATVYRELIEAAGHAKADRAVRMDPSLGRFLRRAPRSLAESLQDHRARWARG